LSLTNAILLDQTNFRKDISLRILTLNDVMDDHLTRYNLVYMTKILCQMQCFPEKTFFEVINFHVTIYLPNKSQNLHSFLNLN